MTDAASIIEAAEKWYGIKTDYSDATKLLTWLTEKHRQYGPEFLEELFSSGRAAAFLTVNETYFFRESVHFKFLLELLPSFHASWNFPNLRICCAAVAAGCEAYSIAMLIEAYNKGLEKPLSYHIDAFDINPGVIEIACRGIYGFRTLREDGSNFHYMTEPWLKKKDDGLFMENSIKKNLSFFVHNLMNEIPLKDYDIIFFRNAFIYFTALNRERILTNLVSALKEEGHLIFGVSETAGVKHPELDAKNKNNVFYFQKKKNMLI